MTFVIIVILLVLVGATGQMALSTRKKNRTLSKPGQKIMDIYNTLPPESQEKMPGIKDKLKALDNKLGRDNVNEHFTDIERDYRPGGGYNLVSKFTWTKCYEYDHAGANVNNSCKYHIYRQIANEIQALQKAVAKKEALEQRAGIDALGLGDLIQDIRFERGTIEEMSQEMKKRMKELE